MSEYHPLPTSSRDTILKLDKGVEPGCVEIIPRNLVTFQVLGVRLGAGGSGTGSDPGRQERGSPDMVVF